MADHHRRSRRPQSAAALIALMAVVAGGVPAQTSGSYRAVDGIGVYLGVLPAELIRGHPKGHVESTMHGGPPGGAHAHHVVVALFDLGSSDRITDAEVDATLGEIGLAGTAKRLEPFTVADTLTYGNYFEMPARTRYIVRLTISRPGGGPPLTTSFEYDHE